jgi:hypothetical protein
MSHVGMQPVLVRVPSKDAHRRADCISATVYSRAFLKRCGTIEATVPPFRTVSKMYGGQAND